MKFAILITILALVVFTNCKVPLVNRKGVRSDSLINIYFSKYSDSIDLIEKTKVFPEFLKESQFDYRHGGFWGASAHDLLPLRKIIVDKVTSCGSLKLILLENNIEYNVKPKVEENIHVQYEEMSFYDLLQLRYKTLNCNK